MEKFDQLFIERDRCLKIEVSEKDTKTKSRIGGEIPDGFKEPVKCPECGDVMKYFLTLTDEVTAVFEHQKLDALSVFYCADFECLLKSNNDTPAKASIIAVNHRNEPRISGENSMNAIFKGGQISFTPLDAEETKDEEFSIIGGTPTFIQDDELHQKLLKKGYLFLFNFNESTVRKKLDYNEYIFGYGAFYVYAKKEKSNQSFDLSDVKIYWQNS